MSGDNEYWVRCKNCGDPIQLKYKNQISVKCVCCGNMIRVNNSMIDLNPLFKFEGIKEVIE